MVLLNDSGSAYRGFTRETLIIRIWKLECPDISVIIPCYSRSWELSESIESALSQTFRNFEIILVDNNARDVTREVIESFVRKFPDKIRMIHEPEQGVCSARNSGILASRGRFIALQDEDDLMKPHRLEAGSLEKIPGNFGKTFLS